MLNTPIHLRHTKNEAHYRTIAVYNYRALSPDGPTNGNFQRPPIDVSMFLMVSLGVGKRQTSEVLLETALVSRLKAQSRMLKMPSPGFTGGIFS